ncbi:hypothetical protein PanWU01x14_281290 [Parasponia andersonii]|uniref:Uncharacterized protein n=1 Tax=Parasponia andersonii TaxID=3476 RepID=A0A2P5B0Y5_PARAD|nr:hypothetical protein PanWU01x14_281290 [Parasponia andersonii]
MAAKRRPNVDNVDRYGLERLSRGPELVGPVLVGVNGLVLKRRTEEDEDAWREIGGDRSVSDGERKIGLGGERSGDREFPERRSELSSTATGEPANEGPVLV